MEGKISKYFKYRRINKYLKSKDESKYSYLDNIFKYYVDGDLEKLLNRYNFSKIEYYEQICNKGKHLQLDFWYFNLHVNLEFDELDFDYSVYLPGISAEEFDKSFINNNYSKSFNIENFFENFYKMLSKDPRLIRDNKNC